VLFRSKASYRLGPELEICGYGCEDHFLESDTFMHCWESISELFERGATDGLLCDFGSIVLHNGARYNCRVLCRDRRVLLIRPKMALADSGNYRESRYFTAYRPFRAQPATERPYADFDTGSGTSNMHLLPRHLFEAKFGQKYATFGAEFIKFGDGSTVGVESCEELWTPEATHIELALCGVEIIGNGSGSHHELRKLNTRLELMVSATRKCGGVYLYANQRGCDGGRLYYDGGAMIICNGEVLAQASQFSLNDVEVISATIDLEDVRSYRACIPSFGSQSAHSAERYPQNYIVCDDIMLCNDFCSVEDEPVPSIAKSLNKYLPEEECLLGPALWLWDYLRRSGASGFFLPLSGGADSSSVAVIVAAMCDLVTKAAQTDPTGEIANECRRVCCKRYDSLWVPNTPQEMANLVLHTTFMGTSNSSEMTRSRAQRVSSAIGSYHLSINIDIICEALLKVFQIATGKRPRFTSQDGSHAEDLALQNIQARLRMVTSYLFGQLLPWVRGRDGFLLILGSSNVDEGLRGYMTKYDCSSADLNPIGAINKKDLEKMLIFASEKYGIPALLEIAHAPPTAELRPMSTSISEEHSQKDEEEMGMTYDELRAFGRLRKISRCGPVSMFKKLRVMWCFLCPKVVAEKVKRFFFYYSVNRHKMCTITPSYHAEGYSPDDNRFDLRQIIYNTKWTRQFSVIDNLAVRYLENKTPSIAIEGNSSRGGTQEK